MFKNDQQFVLGLLIGSFIGAFATISVSKFLVTGTIHWETLFAGTLGAVGGLLAYRAGMIQAETTRDIYYDEKLRNAATAAIAVSVTIQKLHICNNQWLDMLSENAWPLNPLLQDNWNSTLGEHLHMLPESLQRSIIFAETRANSILIEISHHLEQNFNVEEGTYIHKDVPLELTKKSNELQSLLNYIIDCLKACMARQPLPPAPTEFNF